MNNHSSNESYQKTLSFSPFISGGGPGNVSVSQIPVWRWSLKSLRQIMASPRTAPREAAARTIVERRVVSRYSVDDYGCPRILSKWEVTLHALALSTVVGVVIGFGLVILLVAIHNFSTLKPQGKTGYALVISQEETP